VKNRNGILMRLLRAAGVGPSSHRLESEHIVRRLLRAAIDADGDAEMPLGFDTRVLACVREGKEDYLIAGLARRAATFALVIIALAAAGVYRSSASASTDYESDYALVDNAIENQLR
jgi:hypothetical protein